MIEINFHPSARAEMDEAFHWYRDRSTVAAARFLEEIDKTVKRILAMPLQFPVAPLNCRAASLDKFPYVLFFKIRADSITIVVVAHAKRGPAISPGVLHALYNDAQPSAAR